MRVQRALVLLFVVCGACQEKGGPDDATETGATEGVTEPTTEPTGGATEPTTDTGPAGCVPDACAEMCAGNHDEPCHTPYAGSCEADECVCEKQPDDCEPPPPPVECGDGTCDAGQICVQPGLDCDYGKDPPEFYTPAPACADVPPACGANSDGEQLDCLGAEFCPTHDSGLTEYADGKLTCPAEALDCF